jgi:hypothetical protein
MKMQAEYGEAMTWSEHAMKLASRQKGELARPLMIDCKCDFYENKMMRGRQVRWRSPRHVYSAQMLMKNATKEMMNCNANGA